MDERQGLFGKDTIKAATIGFFVDLVMSLFIILFSIKREYVGTFFSTKTGNQHVQEKFTNNEDDARKFKIFTKNENKWRDTIGEYVTVWVASCLPMWIDEKPEWFTD